MDELSGLDSVERSAHVPEEALLTRERRVFHTALLTNRILTINEQGVASNADGSQRSSVAVAGEIARALSVEAGERLAGQTSGGSFERVCRDFIAATFPLLQAVRPGEWLVENVGGSRGTSHIAAYEPYQHLDELARAIKQDRQLLAVLGNAYSIAPDILVSRAPLSDSDINAKAFLVDDGAGTASAIRRSGQPSRILHAVVSCKWTLRSDRAQNARSEALNLIRNRKGRLPHIAVVTGEPSVTRISSLALGTGDIDCVYHFALPELMAGVEAVGTKDAWELLDMMVQGKRLKDIADLALDLTI